MLKAVAQASADKVAPMRLRILIVMQISSRLGEPDADEHTKTPALRHR